MTEPFSHAERIAFEDALEDAGNGRLPQDYASEMPEGANTWLSSLLQDGRRFTQYKLPDGQKGFVILARESA